MIVEAFLVFNLEHPIDRWPKIALRTTMIVQGSYGVREGLRTNVDESAAYLSTHHDPFDWLDRWKQELDDARLKNTHNRPDSSFPKGMGALGPP